MNKKNYYFFFFLVFFVSAILYSVLPKACSFYILIIELIFLFLVDFIYYKKLNPVQYEKYKKKSREGLKTIITIGRICILICVIIYLFSFQFQEIPSDQKLIILLLTVLLSDRYC